MRQHTVCHIKPQCSIFNAGNQIQFHFTGSIPHPLHHLTLIRHHFLQRIGEHLVAAKQDFRLLEEIDQLIDEINSGGIGNGMQRIIPGKQFLPGERFRARKLHFGNSKRRWRLYLNLFLSFFRNIKQR